MNDADNNDGDGDGGDDDDGDDKAEILSQPKAMTKLSARGEALKKSKQKYQDNDYTVVKIGLASHFIHEGLKQRIEVLSMMFGRLSIEVSNLVSIYVLHYLKTSKSIDPIREKLQKLDDRKFWDHAFVLICDMGKQNASSKRKQAMAERFPKPEWDAPMKFYTESLVPAPFALVFFYFSFVFQLI